MNNFNWKISVELSHFLSLINQWANMRLAFLSSTSQSTYSIKPGFPSRPPANSRNFRVQYNLNKHDEIIQVRADSHTHVYALYTPAYVP